MDNGAERLLKYLKKHKSATPMQIRNDLGISNPADALMRCPTCNRMLRRSTEANKRYWLLLAELSEKLKPNNVQYSRQTWHEYFKEKFLGANEIKLPNGKTRIISLSSADLDKTEFSEYLDRVQVWCGQHDVWLDE